MAITAGLNGNGDTIIGNLNMRLFFDKARQRPFERALTVEAVHDIETIARRWFQTETGTIEQLAYILATAFWETARFKTMEEYADGKAYEGRTDLGNTVPGDGPRYKGRGFPMLTGRRNYTYWQQLTGRPLIAQPALATDAVLSARILIEGMMRGTFTGKKLPDYVNETIVDYRDARRVVNGTDKALEISNIAYSFLDAIKAATIQTPPWEEEPKEPEEPAMPDRQPSPQPVTPSNPSVATASWGGVFAGIWTVLVATKVLPAEFAEPEVNTAVTGILTTLGATIGSLLARRTNSIARAKE